MGKNRKTVLKLFEYIQCDDFAAYLMKMARKGWQFKEWGAGLVFEKGEPEAAVYAVEVFSEGSEYDTRPAVNTQEFAEYCEAAGWKLMDAKRKFCIFKKIQPDAIEILTPEERFQSIAREGQKRIWQQVMPAFWLALLQIFQFSGSSFVNVIFSNLSVLVFVFVWIMFALGLLRCAAFYIWKTKSKRKIAAGETVYYGMEKKGYSILNRLDSMIPGVVLILYAALALLAGEYMPLIITAAALVPVLLMLYLISKFRPDAVTNQILQTVAPILIFLVIMALLMGMLFTNEPDPVPESEIPLTYEEIGGEAGDLEDVRLDSISGIMGSGLRCWLYYEHEHIYYQVYRSPHPWVLDKIWNREMERKYNQLGTDVTELWDADSAVRNVPGSYLVRYKDAILILNFGEDTVFSPAQVETIRRALYESR